MNYFQLFSAPPLFVAVLSIWSVFWKGLALWRAAKAGQRNWFIALLLLSTAGILEIIYLFKYAKTKLTIEELKSILKLNS